MEAALHHFWTSVMLECATQGIEKSWTYRVTLQRLRHCEIGEPHCLYLYFSFFACK
jgi:hypothetical protein